MGTLLTEELKRWIGREVTYTAPEELGPAAIRYFAVALDDDNPLYRDEAFARATRHGGLIAPPTLVCETNQYMTGAPDEHGYIGHAWALPLPSRRFIRGGNDYEFHQPVRPTDRLTVRWRIADIYERETRQGPLLFVVSEARYLNQHGRLLAVNRETNIYRP
ncbi:MAG: MaoC family dehydratase N-terminal domain-containing protein [Candidatus Rokubacteria bacterium]|nr:MaoC family dehydratase N-terminal domain-containing protein [Candidatus Rokubacteria bacterium]